jgi:putative transposase
MGVFELICLAKDYQVDITYVRMQKDFMYLFIIMNWFSSTGRIVDYELSITLKKTYVMHSLKGALPVATPENHQQRSRKSSGIFMNTTHTVPLIH